MTELESLRAFAKAIAGYWPHSYIDGDDLQDCLIEHGLIALKDPKPTEPCGEGCACVEYPTSDEWAVGIDCYGHTPLLTGKEPK